jgi:DNA-binding transcriptional LysR family regulator
LVDWLARLHRERPDIRPQLRELDGDPIELLRSHDTDLVVEHIPAVPKDIEARAVGNIAGYIILPATHRNKRFRMASLRSLSFVAYTESSPEWAIQRRALQSVDLEPDIVATAESCEALTALVAAGLGFSLVPAVAGVGITDPRVFAVLPPGGRVEFPVVAAWRKSAIPNPLINAALAAA